ncbi:hypothetical protein M0G74_18135 [Microbulbifer sp. CAU 1566]|uniref:hypothetical protein n=1 Tax=Microbulbifer sp. CAU 1566 TaxID=2933269 RepID=UPI0020048C84|nr:hypothetical protein [Microbulbifer sp. CAU 1566]MCK7599196.1 hypothetical protein [Microbulbifer sp. CAU 1566]
MKIFIIIFTVLVSACSGMTFNTNLGPYAKNRVKTVIVEEYSPVEISKYDAITLGIVEASYCQERIDEPKPSKRAVVNDLKVRTHSLGGNGVVVEACGTAANGACTQYLECRGVAYSVPQRQSRP